MKIIPGTIPTAQFHAYLLGAVAPRPICFASTISADGVPNLAPFSFFNVFGSKPPIAIFSPARRVRDNTTKHSLQNVQATGEVVINVVNYDMVQQMSLASCEYPADVNEFEKSGFTPVASDIVKPFRVKESPAQLECKVLQVIETGTEGGAANLIICEVVVLHLNDAVLDVNGQIDPHKIDLVARMGRDYYCRASGSSVFEVPKPNTQLGIGLDALPPLIRFSKYLTGNHLGLLGNSTSIPLVASPLYDDRLTELLKLYGENETLRREALHQYAAELLDQGAVDKAWQVLLAGEGGPGPVVME